MKKRSFELALVLLFAMVPGLYLLYREYISTTKRTHRVLQFLQNPAAHQGLIIPALSRFADAPFVMPTSGLIGFIWKDFFRDGHHHQGIDIFSGAEVGETPVFAAYDGYLTRLIRWKSAVIIRIPTDPLRPDRQIWTYYAHMADPMGKSLVSDEFPPGISEKFVSAGTLLGYQGNYSGRPDSPTGVHLHFSIVKDDGKGMFLNELKVRNTVDPSPYFGLPLNAKDNKDLTLLVSPA